MLGKIYDQPQVLVPGDAEVVTKYKKGDYEYQEPDTLDEGLNIFELIDEKNIAELLDEKTLLTIAADVIEGYDIDKTSRAKREEIMEKALNMALHITKPKDTPWPNSSNIIYPIISEAALGFAARAYPALLRDDAVVEVLPVGNDSGIPAADQFGNPIIDQNGQPAWRVQPGLKRARAGRVAEYMNYQFSEEMEEWEEDTDRMLHALPIVGDMFRKVWWDYEEERVKTELIWPKYLIINNNSSGFKRAPRISEEKEYYPHEIEEFIRCGLWVDFKFGVASNEGKEEESERQGEAEKSDKSALHFFIEQCRRIDLDDDGYAEPYRVLVHKESKTVVRILADYQEDGIKKNDKGQIKRIVPETYYIQYPFIPSPDGSVYSMGFGELLYHSSDMINSLFNQLIDAGTLANTSHGFIGDGLKIKGGKVEITKGKFTKVDTRGLSIRDNLVQIQHPEPSVTLFQLLGMLIESTKNLGGLKDVLNGEALGANQPGITTLTLIEQGLTAFKSIYKRIGRSLRNEIKAVYRLNSLYLHDETYRNVMDSQIYISRADFNTTDIDIRPNSAPHMVSDMQRLSRAAFLEGYRDDPYVNGFELRRRIFDMANVDKPEELLQEPPPAPEDPNVALQKALIEVEGYKAQIREKEAIVKSVESDKKSQREGLLMEMKLSEAAHKAQMAEMASRLKEIDAVSKIQIMNRETELKAMEAHMKSGKVDAEIQKIGAQVLEILTNMELQKQKFQLEAMSMNNEPNNEIGDIKRTLDAILNKEDIDIESAITPLVEAIKEIKNSAGEKDFTVEIQSIKDSMANVSKDNISAAIAPLADAIRSLKASEKKISIKRGKDGEMQGTIEPVDGVSS